VRVAHRFGGEVGNHGFALFGALLVVILRGLRVWRENGGDARESAPRVSNGNTSRSAQRAP
jgi:hypothetical protein